jgi:hypothetical protein
MFLVVITQSVLHMDVLGPTPESGYRIVPKLGFGSYATRPFGLLRRQILTKVFGEIVLCSRLLASEPKEVLF